MVCERANDENGVAFFASRRQNGGRDFFYTIGNAFCCRRRMESVGRRQCCGVFFLAAAVVFSYSLFLLFSACGGWQKALSPTVAAVLFAGGLAVGGNGGLSEIEDWCYDMGVCIGGLISEKDCLAHGGKWTAADGGACYMNWSVVKPNSAE